MNLTLGQAYLEQAKADFASYAELKARRQPVSQWLHFLQMTMEKTGKAYLASSGSELEQLRQSHLAFGRFLRLIVRNRMIQQTWPMPTRQLQRHLANILPLTDSIERLTPALSNGPNVEYPWKLPDGQIAVPCHYDFQSIFSLLESVTGRNLLKIVERAIYNHDWHLAFRL